MRVRAAWPAAVGAGAVVCVVGLIGGVVRGGLDSDTPTARDESVAGAEQTAPPEESFLSVDADGVLVVDVERDPDGASEFLADPGEEYDEYRRIRVEGVEVAPSEVRRARDLRLLADSPPPDSSAQERRTVLSSLTTVGAPDAEAVLRRAIVDVVEARGTREPGVGVRISGETARVDFAGAASVPTTPQFPADGTEFLEELLGEAARVAGLTSIEFTIDGDCLAFSVALGGDACAGPIAVGDR